MKKIVLLGSTGSVGKNVLNVARLYPDKFKICTSYKYEGKTYESDPGMPGFLEKCDPQYEEHKGWKQDTSGITAYEDLPQEAKNYLARIKELIGTDIILVSVGKSRKQTLACPEI